MKRQRIQHIPAVAVIFNDKGQVLLSQRFHPKRPDVHLKWQLPGGKVEFGEHPKDAAIREIREEVGIEVKLLSEHPLVYSNVYRDFQVHAIILLYPALYLRGKIDVSQDEKTKDARWVDVKDVKDELSLPLLRKMIEDAEKFVKIK